MKPGTEAGEEVREPANERRRSSEAAGESSEDRTRGLEEAREPAKAVREGAEAGTLSLAQRKEAAPGRPWPLLHADEQVPAAKEGCHTLGGGRRSVSNGRPVGQESLPQAGVLGFGLLVGTGCFLSCWAVCQLHGDDLKMDGKPEK